MMPARPLACTRCGVALPEGAPGVPVVRLCPGCGAEEQVTVFPALGRGLPTGSAPQLVISEGEAACFYHPDKRATVPCEACGRFLCALCDVEVGGKHFCPGCLGAGGKTAKPAMLERARTRYDQVMWSLLLVPVLMCFLPAPITSTAALGLAIWKWRAPTSLIINTRRRLALGMVLAVIEMVAGTWIWLRGVSFST